MDTQSSRHSTGAETIVRTLLWCVVVLAVVLHIAQFASLPSFFEGYAVRPVKLEVVNESGPVLYRVVAIDEKALSAPIDLRVGDVLQRDSPARYAGRLGEAPEFTIVGRDDRKTIAIPYVRAPIPNDVVVHDIAWPIVQCLQLALGVILLRNRTAGKPALALAAPLVLMGMPDLGAALPVPVNAMAARKAIDVLISLYPLGVPLFTVFAYEFARPQLSTAEGRYAKVAAWLLPLLAGGFFLLDSPFLIGLTHPLAPGLYALSWVLVWCFVVGILVVGLRRTTGDLRERYASVAISAGYLLAVYVAWNIYAWWLGHWTYTAAVIATLLIFAGVVALTVSLLRHHVVELRVVASRTLVFSIVSALLLLAFALAEFASDKLLHFEGRESNILLDAGVALILFVTARRLHHGVERFVQRTLFRPWHLALEGLRDFARDAGYITNADVLRGRLLAALARFAGVGSDARLFHRGDDGRFTEWRRDGAAAQTINENDAWLVTMRATLEPVQRSVKHPDIPAALAAPILRTGHVTGFVLIGPKPNDQSYRSDELAAIKEVLGKVALDLECLRAIEAEAQLRELRSQSPAGSRPVEPPRLVS